MAEVWQAVYLAAICLVFLLLPVCESFQWTGNLEIDAHVSACVDGNISLPWNFTTLPGETIQDIRWNYQVTGREELIATYVADRFFASPAFSQRVQYVAYGGLVLNPVTVSDSGNYTVEVAVRDAGSTHTFSDYRKTAFVEVVADFDLVQEPEAVYAPVTDSWHVTLSCGTVVGSHTADVLWKTPHGDLPSTSTHNGHFFLQLPNPVKGGNYSCVVPPTAKSCSPSGSRKVTLVVDKTETRLTLIEAENKNLRKLVNDLNRFKVTASRRVAFHARLSVDRQVNFPNSVILDVAVLNEGDAYSNTTGSLTVPYTGTYFIVATTADFSSSPSGSGVMSVMMDNSWLCTAYSLYLTHYETSTCHVTVHLNAGQRVWLRSETSNNYFYSSLTAFSGFLLHADE